MFDSALEKDFGEAESLLFRHCGSKMKNINFIYKRSVNFSWSVVSLSLRIFELGTLSYNLSIFMMFSPIKKRNISALVFDQLRDNIYRGEINPGEQLIPEKELAAIMQVSRVSIRKAITQLIEMGYVESRPGQGVFVKIPESGDSHNPFAYVMTPGQSSLDELLEVRIGLECHGVSIAAERATDQDIAFLESSFTELSKGQPNQKVVDADIKFHMGIAYATHNSVHIDLTRRFHDYLFYSISKLHSILYEKNKNLNNIEKHHFKILDAIRCRETENARKYMLEHISFLRIFLKKESLAIL